MDPEQKKRLMNKLDQLKKKHMEEEMKNSAKIAELKTSLHSKTTHEFSGQTDPDPYSNESEQMKAQIRMIIDKEVALHKAQKENDRLRNELIKVNKKLVNVQAQLIEQNRECMEAKSENEKLEKKLSKNNKIVFDIQQKYTIILQELCEMTKLLNSK